MKFECVGLILALTIVALAGCGGQEAPTSEIVSSAYTSDVLDMNYEGALDIGNQLALGTLKLEEVDEQHPVQAVTPEQAKSLLPLWQALQGEVVAQAEVDAVLNQIEGTMTEEQLRAVTDMQLTQEDMQAWLKEHGLGMGGGLPGASDMSDEERERLRATAEAGGGRPEGDGPFGDLSEEERANMRATMEAGGGRPDRPGGGPGDGRPVGVLIGPLIDLLTERAEE